MPRTITVQDDTIVLEVTPQQAAMLDRALTGFTKALLAARDMGVISHGTFCTEADVARKVQFPIWDEIERVKAMGAKP
jgi:hypothetical protein